MRLYTTNTLSTVEIRPRQTGRLLMQVCGPTVYDGLHLGHVRTFIFFDVLARTLRRSGYEVYFNLNFTDIDEDVFEKARKEGVPYKEISDRFCKKTLKTLSKLNIRTPTYYPRASEYIQKSVEIVKKLTSKGLAYELNGNIFLDFDKIVDHGPVSNLSRGRLRNLRLDSYDGKRGPLDFLLWFKSDEKPYWESPWGIGRPGWHLQDVVIANDVFKGPHDLHGGAVELVYPHHDCLECLGMAVEDTVPYVPYWVHTCILMIEGKKMSKSDGNIIYADEILGECPPEALRAYFLSKSREEELNFKMEDLLRYKEILEDMQKRLHNYMGSSAPSKNVLKLKNKFFEELFYDMDTRSALNLFFKMTETAMREGSDLKVLSDAYQILGLEGMLLKK
jgi:cysteinyl-tRNA synthetase